MEADESIEVAAPKEEPRLGIYPSRSPGIFSNKNPADFLLNEHLSPPPGRSCGTSRSLPLLESCGPGGSVSRALVGRILPTQTRRPASHSATPELLQLLTSLIARLSKSLHRSLGICERCRQALICRVHQR